MAELHKLPNGLEVLLEENHASPVIAFHVLVKVGSAMETAKEAGICHVIEHMLFKGTPTRKVGEIAKDVESAGGEINAYTSFDQTVYYINMASRYADKGLSILADAVQNPLFDDNELQREKEVILEEIRREKDNPSHRATELMFEKSYKRHPYKNPIIGYEHTVKSFGRNGLLDFYKRWYTPKNMTLVVVGDFKTPKILKDIKKSFKKFKGGPAPYRILPRELPSRDILIHLEEDPILAAYFTISFHIPEITHSDIPALDVLSHILAGSDSSILQQEIREKKQLVNEVYAYAYTPKDPGLFIIGGLTSPAKTDKGIETIWDEICKLHSEPVKNAEIDRAKLVIESNAIYEKETAGGQAGKYAYFMATANTYLFEEEYYKNLKNVQAKDVGRVAQKYLTPRNLNLIVVHPKENKKHINAGALRSHFLKKKSASELNGKTQKNVRAATLKRLPNGIKLIIREDHTLPIVACAAVLHGGLRFENKNNNGINNLLARTITKGTENKTAVEVAKSIESVAGFVDAFSGRNSFGLKSEFLSSKFSEGFGLFTEILTKPRFDDSEIRLEKKQMLDDIKNQEDALMSLAFIKFLAKLFPHHPYGLKTLGETRSVKNLTRRMLANYYQSITRPENMVLSVVGDVSVDEVVRAARSRLIFKVGARKKLPTPKPELPPKKPVTIEHIRAEKEQAHIVMGFLGPTITSKDHYAVAVLNNILSGQGGRLFITLRDRMSLAYSVTSTYFAGLEPGYFAVYIGTEPSKIGKALDGIRYEFETLLKKGVTSEELARSKRHIIGTYELEKQRNLSLASNYAFNQLFKLSINEVLEYPKKISAVTKNDILRVSKKYLRIDAPITAIVKPK